MSEAIYAPDLGSELVALASRIAGLEAAIGMQQYAAANRPPAANHRGGLLYNSTTGRHEGSDGSKWRPLHGYGCRAERQSVQGIANAAWTPILFDLEQFDTDGMHSTTVNAGRFTCLQAGVYECIGNVVLATTAGAIAAWMLNGATFHGLSGHAAVVGSTWVSASTIIQLAPGDYVEFAVFQSSGGLVNISASATTPAIGSVLLT